MAQVPTTHGNWIDYGGKAFIVEAAEEGQHLEYNYGGVMCRSGEFTGNLIADMPADDDWANNWYPTSPGSFSRMPIDRLTAIFKAVIKSATGWDVEIVSIEEAEVLFRHTERMYLLTWENYD